ncbi:ABC transporter ATP-binding protein [Pelagibius marinus]|uniref:ABC transporter ATP-binding protein n=1 Tax=Pelagibius marinus TaxID=2762760 RepID=UPI001872C751|nr:ATP-binding cassette domain-containing protein [Pelagibius marinus]
MAAVAQETPTQTRTDDAVVRIQGLQAHYGARQVLHDIELTVAPGEIMVIMGGSGSGKSTLLRHLVGLMRPTAGSVELLGVDITRAPALEMQRLRRRIGVAFQGGALFSSMNVLDNIMLPLREHTQLDRQTMEIMARLKLEVVNLAGAEDLMPAELSGGMVKRAAVARAIVMDPALLFFDEPSAGLDPAVSSALDDLILKLREAMNMSIVVVTHELESAFKIADRITVLDQGRILTVDDVAGIRRSDNARIQNLLNRRAENAEVDAETYLRRLTGEAAPAGDPQAAGTKQDAGAV